MRIVNFIADPWEWPLQKPLRHKDEYWYARYRRFKLRLHWLLLWYDQIQVLDSFALFNRQIEHWVQDTPKQEGRPAQSVIERLLGSDRAIVFPLRSKTSRGEFQCLRDVDEAHVRVNPTFVWYPDGAPRKTFSKCLDRYLGLPNEGSPIYRIGQHREMLQSAFDRAMGDGKDFDPLHEEFSDLAKRLSVDSTKELPCRGTMAPISAV